MRWKRLTRTEKATRRVHKATRKAEAFKAIQEDRMARGLIWTRYFAWRPYHDDASGMVYFLEYVWARARNSNHYMKQFPFQKGQAPIEVTVKYPWNWEYRGGKDAPEIKLDPGGL